MPSNKNESKPSVAFYIDCMQKGGANRVVANLVSAFADNDYRVILINDTASDDEELEYRVDTRVNRIILCGKDEKKRLSNFRRIRKLRKIIKKDGIDVVVSFMGPPNIRLLSAGIGLKCRKIVSVRNDPNIEYGASKTKRFLTNLIFRLSDGCVFQTNDAKRYFCKTVQKRSKVILNPVDPAFYKVERKKERKNIVTVGRLFDQKNHLMLIDAFNMVKDNFPDNDLMIYGEGPLRKTLEDHISGLGLSERVFLPGQVSNVTGILSGAAVFVLSSKYEGLPNALMEAMAVGLPVISTDCPCGGPRSLIDDRDDGLLVGCDDTAGMAEALSKVLSDGALSEKLGDGARKKALSFAPDVIYNEWEEFLLECK